MPSRVCSEMTTFYGGDFSPDDNGTKTYKSRGGTAPQSSSDERERSTTSTILSAPRLNSKSLHDSNPNSRSVSSQGSLSDHHQPHLPCPGKQQSSCSSSKKFHQASQRTKTSKSSTGGNNKSAAGFGGDGGSGSQHSMSTATSTEDRHKELDSPIQNLYEIRTRLGKGAYGIVWEAKVKATGKKVALKKIFDAFRNNTDAQRTYREIMFLKSFGHHPKVIELIDVHRAENDMDIYLVFPLMDYDLHKIIKWKPKLLTNMIVRQICYEMLVGIHYLHSAEVIHRDLKPANILLDTGFHVKIADFGLARSLAVVDDYADHQLETQIPIMTEYVATRWYRPPEILLSCRLYTKGVDMWAVACILGEMYMTKPVFAGNSTLEQIEIIMGTITEPTQQEIDEMMSGTSKATLTAALKASLQTRGAPVEDIFHQWGVDLVDFVERLLIFSPDKRLTADEALCHPFFDGFRQRHLETICEAPVRPPLSDSVQLKLDEYRATIYDLIKMCHHSSSNNNGNNSEEDEDELLYAIPEVGFEDEEEEGLDAIEAVDGIYSSSTVLTERSVTGRNSSPQRQPSNPNEDILMNTLLARDGTSNGILHPRTTKSQSQPLPVTSSGFGHGEKGRAVKSILTIPSVDNNPYQRYLPSEPQGNYGHQGLANVSRPVTASHSSTAALTLTKDYDFDNTDPSYKYEYVINKTSGDRRLKGYPNGYTTTCKVGDGSSYGSGDSVNNNSSHLSRDPFQQIQLPTFTFPKTSKIGNSSSSSDPNGKGLTTVSSSSSYEAHLDQQNEQQHQSISGSLYESKFGEESGSGGGGGYDSMRRNYSKQKPSTSYGINGQGASISSSAAARNNNPFYDYQQLLASKAASNNGLHRSGPLPSAVGAGGNNNGNGVGSSKSSSLRGADTRNDTCNANKKLHDLLTSCGGSGGGELLLEKRIDMIHRRVNAKGRMNQVPGTDTTALHRNHGQHQRHGQQQGSSSSKSMQLQGGKSNTYGSLASRTTPSGSTLTDQDLILVNGRSTTASSLELAGRRTSNQNHHPQKHSNKADYFRFGGKKDLQEDPADVNKRPFNGRSNYGKLHKLPSMKHGLGKRDNNAASGFGGNPSPWDNDHLTQFPKPSTAIPERGRTALRKPQVSQSAYFPSTTLYSKNVCHDQDMNRRKTSSEPSGGYYQRLRSPTKHNTRFASGSRHNLQTQGRQNWRGESVLDIYPEMQGTMHASDLFDLQNNIHRGRYPHS